MSFILKTTVFVLFMSLLACGRAEFIGSDQGSSEKSVGVAAAVGSGNCADLTDDQIIAKQVERIQQVIRDLGPAEILATQNAQRFLAALLADTSVRRSVIEQERLFCEKGPLCPLAKAGEVVLVSCSENPHALDVLGTSVAQ